MNNGVFTRDLILIRILINFHLNVHIITQWVMYPPMGINRYPFSKYNNITVSGNMDFYSNTGATSPGRHCKHGYHHPAFGTHVSLTLDTTTDPYIIITFYLFSMFNYTVITADKATGVSPPLSV